MSINIKSIIFFFSIIIFNSTFASAEELKKIGKFKDWETLVLVKDGGLERQYPKITKCVVDASFPDIVWGNRG